MSTEAMKLARSVISSINSGRQHALTVNDETVFWQREEWVRWALDEVLPQIEEALAKQEQGEPHSWYSAQEDEWMTEKTRKDHERLNSYTHKVGGFDLALYTTQQQRTKVVFPTMLRKMWSGGEVQAWLDENVNKEKST